MKKKILSLLLGLCLLTGTSTFAATGPINTTSSGTTFYDYNNGIIASMVGTYTNYTVAAIKAKNKMYAGSTLLGETESFDTNTHYVLAYSNAYSAYPGTTYIVYGTHTAIDKGVTYTHNTINYHTRK